jgi:hypothetical protein
VSGNHAVDSQSACASSASASAPASRRIHAPAHHLASKQPLKVDEIPFGCGAPYLLDACGRACPHHCGEGARDRSEMAIPRLLAEFGVGGPRDGVVSVEAGLSMRRMAFVMVEIVALASVVAAMAAPIWTGLWTSSRRQGCPGHR